MEQLYGEIGDRIDNLLFWWEAVVDRGLKVETGGGRGGVAQGEGVEGGEADESCWRGWRIFLGNMRRG
jgi:hypothetical protein